MSNINIDVKVFEQRTSLDDFLGFNNSNQTPTTTASTNTNGAVSSDLDSIFALWNQPTGTDSNTNGAFANLNTLFADSSQTPTRVEDYGGFQFKNEGEKSAVDQALAELRAQQAANPGKAVSKKIKVGKYKITINLKEDGTVEIKRKKKRGGLFGGIGNFFKKVGGFLKKALPIISTIAMFIPGLQPLALAGRIASGVMGVVDGIKNGNIFGALTSAVGAFSGIGGKVGSFFSGIGSKASGFLGSIGGGAGNWFSNALNTATGAFSKVKDLWSGFTGGIGTKVSDFLFNNGSSLFKNGMSELGSNLLRSFSDSMGNRAVNWLNEKASNVMSRLMNNPLAQRVGGFLNSGFGQMLMEFIRGRQA